MAYQDVLVIHTTNTTRNTVAVGLDDFDIEANNHGMTFEFNFLVFKTCIIFTSVFVDI